MRDILLLHGAIGSKEQFGPLVSGLQGKFKVHLLNFRGHGGSEMPEIFSIQNFADDVLEYLSDNNIGSIDIFGYSMGGYVALYLAKLRPEKVNRIFTLATKFNWSAEIALRETKMLDASRISEKIPAFANELKARHAPNDWEEVLHKTAQMMLDMGNNNPLQIADFHDIELPVRISIGDKDAMVTLEETIEVYRKLPNATLGVFPDTQHPVEKVRTESLAEAIEGFFV